MRVSKSFLNDYVDIQDIDYKELAEKMVFAGNEYESLEQISSATSLVIGYVVESEKHPDSSKLSICKVDIGDGNIKQILCGAANVARGQKVIVAQVGATLPGGITITKAKLAGLDSEGMICALDELGIESRYLNEEEKKGICVLDEDAPLGTDAIKYLGYDDEVINFELTADRSDLLSILGMAYEVGALYDRQVKFPVMSFNELKEDINDNYQLDVATNNCYIYLAKLVKNVVIKESPYFIKTRLIASGIRPINNVVDISNYVMLEMGQPLHFFDADQLGKKINVRMSNDNEKMVTLDGNERNLMPSDIVIANYNEAVALAGVMGGLSTEVTADTKNIIIESAVFNPYNIRYTSKRILRSEASMRYEKGVDHNRTLLALNRACYLLSIYADGEVSSGMLSHDITEKNDKQIIVTVDRINSVLGMNLTESEIGRVFDKLQFNYTIEDGIFNVFVPTRRMDVNIKEGLIEEVGRIIGYDNVVGVLPKTLIKSGKYLPKALLTKKIRARLQSLGLNQVITYSLINAKDSNKFIDNDYEVVTLLDPMSEDKKNMRNSLITSLIDVYNYNSARNIKDINIFEIGSCYSKKGDTYLEEVKISGLMIGNYITNNWQNKTVKADFYVLKGVIENILNYLGLINRYSFDNNTILNNMHPGRSCSVIINNEVIGYLGQVHPSLSKKELYVFELSLDKLMDINVRDIKFKEMTKYPSVNKDVAFIVSKDTISADIMKVIKKVGGRLLTSIDVFDVYEGPNVGETEKSIAYSLSFQDPMRTLNDEEVTTIFNKIISEVENQLNAKVRNK